MLASIVLVSNQPWRLRRQVPVGNWLHVGPRGLHVRNQIITPRLLGIKFSSFPLEPLVLYGRTTPDTASDNLLPSEVVT